MFLPVVVLDWRIDGGRRVPDKTNGNLHILSTYGRMFEITEAYDHNMRLRFYDNPADSRCGGAWMKIDTTLAGILNAADADFGDNMVTLDMYPDNDTAQATTEITLQKVAVSYCIPFGNDQSNALSWVVFVDAANDIKKILVNHSWIPLYLLLQN
jgi:hypothetical protein